jgi:hypothetical protein
VATDITGATGHQDGPVCHIIVLVINIVRISLATLD